MAEKRFVKTYTAMDMMEIWVDREPGGNDLWYPSGHAGGLAPLLARDGKITKAFDKEERTHEAAICG